MNNVIVC